MKEQGMKFYMAPMEGITGYIYRNAYSMFFPKFDKYFTPFLSPHGEKEQLTHKEKTDVAPEHNQGLFVVPQILTNKPAEFIRVANYLKGLGYEEVNLNLGCPSGTVVSKYKGSGFLAKPVELKVFLEEIFEALDMKISVKTRIGMEKEEEFRELLEIFNKFPLEELIIHPRLREEYYKGVVHREIYREAAGNTALSLCYNGDLWLERHIGELKAYEPGTQSAMIGRGILRNPGLLYQIQNGKMPEKTLIRDFHEKLYQDYCEVMPGRKPALYKMKELWSYMGPLFTGWEEAYAKQMRKCNELYVYEQIVGQIFLYEDYSGREDYLWKK